ncbi:type II secretion system F family protein [Ornithinibacillus sp. JPR2-1]|uniref:type II secretion system F family protein n=1 Tax=Ornithinibacillus sp. JPR2-1 TaxID=2094019 RepID=UPI0031D7C5E7
MDLSLKIPLRRFNKKLNIATQLTFLKRLSRALTNGYPLLAALETLKWDKNLYHLAEDIIYHIKRGYTLDQSLEKLSFHPIITSYLFFAKEHGDLDASITKCLAIFEKRIHHLKKFTQVIRYPIILLIVFSIAFLFIQHSVVPNLLTLFQQHEQDSFIIHSAIGLSSLLYYSTILILIALFIMYWIWKRIKATIPIGLQIKIYRSIPLYRSYLTLNTSFLFATHVESLLKTGLPIKDVLTILSKQEKLPLLSYYATQLTNGLNHGVPISQLMTELTFISPQLASIFQQNSNADTLEKDLGTYSAYITEEINEKIVKFITYIQPVFFILLGLVIILIYLSLLVPMYQFIETI